MDLEAIRAELGVLGRSAYLNAGTFGPLPRRTLDAMAAADRLDFDQGRTGAWYPVEILELRERARAAFAAAISAPADSVALTRSTTEGCAIVVSGLGLGSGDEIVTTDVEHFGLLGSLGASAAKVRVARLRGRDPSVALDAIREQLTPATRLIALSDIAWTTGQILPIREIAELGVPLLVDGAQSAGAIAVAPAETGAAFYAFSGQKWLLGPGATGGLYVAPEWIDRLAVTSPSYYSQQGYDQTGSFTPTAGAARFDTGWQSRGTLEGSLASLAFLTEMDEGRFARAQEMAAKCRALLSGRVELVTPEEHATLITWLSDDAPAESRWLAGEGVIVRNLPNLPWVRASVGFWTTDADLERLATALGQRG